MITFPQFLLHILIWLVTVYGPTVVVVFFIFLLLHRRNMTGWFSDAPMTYKDGLFFCVLWPFLIFGAIIFLTANLITKIFTPLEPYMIRLWDGPRAGKE